MSTELAPQPGRVSAAVQLIAARLLAIATVALLLLRSPTARADPPAQQAAVARARVLALAQSDPWKRLLLYERGADHGWVSHAGVDFFFALDGKHNPTAELEATLAAFFVPITIGDEDSHAICKFPARFRWLDEQIHIGSTLLAKPRCKALDDYVATLDAESASFVYAASFLDNPVSALGHAFLRIKKRVRGALGTSESRDLRDHGIDYSAETDTSNPLLYAVKGIAGQFPGRFRLRSYEVMLRDYAGYEARDLWEYGLALSPSEMELLVFHLWELTHVRIDYFYMSENCAYQMIAVLDAAAPRLDLVARVKAVVLPIDAVKAVHDSPGLVRGIIYRPSVRSLFDAALAKLEPRERALVQVLAKDSDATLPAGVSAASAARILDAAQLAIDARWSKTMMDGDNPNALNARVRLAERRAAITSIPSAPRMSQAPRDKEPHKSHGSMRLVLGTGMTTQYNTGFATLGYRLVLHDLVDPPDGQPELMQLQALEVRVRYDYGREKLTLDSATFVELMAIKPLTRGDHELSWRVRAFGTRLHDRAAPDAFAHGLDGSIGGAIATGNRYATVFLMADAYVIFSGDVDGIRGSVVRAGVGPFGGVRVRLPWSTVGLVTGAVSNLPAQSLDATFDLRAILRTQLGPHVAMGVEGAAQPHALDVQLASYLYF